MPMCFHELVGRIAMKLQATSEELELCRKLRTSSGLLAEVVTVAVTSDEIDTLLNARVLLRLSVGPTIPTEVVMCQMNAKRNLEQQGVRRQIPTWRVRRQFFGTFVVVRNS